MVGGERGSPRDPLGGWRIYWEMPWGTPGATPRDPWRTPGIPGNPCDIPWGFCGSLEWGVDAFRVS